MLASTHFALPQRAADNKRAYIGSVALPKTPSFALLAFRQVTSARRRVQIAHRPRWLLPTAPNPESTSKSKFHWEIGKPSPKELLAQRQTLQQQVSAARQREAEVVLTDIVRKMHEYQISLADLMGRKGEC